MRRILRRATLGFVLLANAVLMFFAWQGLLRNTTPPDWQGIVDAAVNVAQGVDPYAGQAYGYRWSPVAAWLLIPFVSTGLLVWQLLHFGALALLPWRGIALCLACFAFWVDVAMGNVVVFGFVLAYLALTRRAGGVLAFTALALLVPRPLYIPVLVWLWLYQPEQRRLMAGTTLVIGVLTLATGYAWSWLEVLATSGNDVGNVTNMAPSRLVGMAWLPFGALGAIWAFRRGRLGLASLLASPYWLPYYFLKSCWTSFPRPLQIRRAAGAAGVALALGAVSRPCRSWASRSAGAAGRCRACAP